MRSLLVAAPFLAAAAACGTDPALRHADETMHVVLSVSGEAQGTISAAESRGDRPDEIAAARSAFDDLSARVSQAEESIAIWYETGTGKAAWMTIAPCLAAAIGALEETFEAAFLRVPEEASQARVMAEESSSSRCSESRSRGRREDQSD